MLGIGAVFSFFFHLGTTESSAGAGAGAGGEEGRREMEEEEEEGERRPLLPRPQISSSLLQWKCWLQQPSFYQVGRFYHVQPDLTLWYQYQQSLTETSPEATQLVIALLQLALPISEALQLQHFVFFLACIKAG